MGQVPSRDSESEFSTLQTINSNSQLGSPQNVAPTRSKKQDIPGPSLRSSTSRQTSLAMSTSRQRISTISGSSTSNASSKKSWKRTLRRSSTKEEELQKQKHIHLQRQIQAEQAAIEESLRLAQQQEEEALEEALEKGKEKAEKQDNDTSYLPDNNIDAALSEEYIHNNYFPLLNDSGSDHRRRDEQDYGYGTRGQYGLDPYTLRTRNSSGSSMLLNEKVLLEGRRTSGQPDLLDGFKNRYLNAKDTVSDSDDSPLPSPQMDRIKKNSNTSVFDEMSGVLTGEIDDKSESHRSELEKGKEKITEVQKDDKAADKDTDVSPFEGISSSQLLTEESESRKSETNGGSFMINKFETKNQSTLDQSSNIARDIETSIKSVSEASSQFGRNFEATNTTVPNINSRSNRTFEATSKSTSDLNSHFEGNSETDMFTDSTSNHQDMSHTSNGNSYNSYNINNTNTNTFTNTNTNNNTNTYTNSNTNTNINTNTNTNTNSTSSNARRRLNPFSRLNRHRLNILNPVIPSSAADRESRDDPQSIHSSQSGHSDEKNRSAFGHSNNNSNNSNNSHSASNSVDHDSGNQAHGHESNSGHSLMPMINLSSLAHRNNGASHGANNGGNFSNIHNHTNSSSLTVPSLISSPLSSPMTANSGASTPSTEQGGSSFVHQAQMLSRLLELAAHSTLHNLIGDYEGSDGVRIDNRNRNRDLRNRVPNNRFEDGSDSNFSEFTTALQGNLLANELSNSMRMQLDRERRRQAGDTSGTTQGDERSQSMSFFRAFRFSSRPPRNNEDDEDDDGDEEQVPVLIIGVRSVLPEETEHNNMNGENSNNPNTAGISNQSATTVVSPPPTIHAPGNNRTASQGSVSIGNNADVASSENSNSSESLPTNGTNSNSTTANSNNSGSSNRGFARSFFRNRNHRSRFRLENSRNNNRLEEIAHNYSQSARARNGSQRSWVIFIMGHSFPVDHPVLSAPTLLSDNPTYEDLLALQAMLGEVKPPVATQEDIDRAGGLVKIVIDDNAQSLKSADSQISDDYFNEHDADEDEDEDDDIEDESNDEDFNKLRENGAEMTIEVESIKLEDLDPIRVSSTDKCLVCLTEYEDDEICRQLKACKHIFHKECIDQWLVTGRNSCPLCRKKGVPVKKKKKTEETDTEGRFGTNSLEIPVGEF